MKFITLVPYYFVWHYTRAVRDLIEIGANFVWFIYNYFSIKVLFSTLFAPYKRLTEKYRGGLDIEKFLESIVVNLLMRIIGFVMRTAVLVVGLIAILVTFVAGAVLIVVWLLLPIILLIMFTFGLLAIISNQQLEI